MKPIDLILIHEIDQASAAVEERLSKLSIEHLEILAGQLNSPPWFELSKRQLRMVFQLASVTVMAHYVKRLNQGTESDGQ